MKNKLISIFLIISMMTILLAACQSKNGGEAKNEETTSQTAAGTTTEAVTGREAINDELPQKNFEGANFNILCRTERKYEFFSEEETGDLINDAVYKRNTIVEERFNVKINVIDLLGDWDNKDNFMNKMSNSVMAGEGAYDLIAGYQAYFMGATTAGQLYDVNRLSYIDFDKPWWVKSILDELTVDKKLYVLAGDLSFTMWEYMYAVYFNKTMAKNYNVPDLYALAREGKWTLDAMNNIIKDIHEDVNGDGKMDKADRYGYATETGNLVDLFMAAFDIKITKRGDDGLPKIVLGDELSLEKLNSVYSFINENPGVVHQPESVSTCDNPLDALFREDRALFLPDSLGNSKKLRSYETDFGILPLPKYDEKQEKYQVYPQNGYSILGVPIDTKNIDMTACIIEAMCAESYKKVVPVFYDQALKYKFTRDGESSEMIDLIRGGILFDFGMLYTNIIDHPGSILRDVGEKKNNFASKIERTKGVWEKNLDKLLAELTK